MKIYLLLLFLLSSTLSYADEAVVLQLKWKHQFQFAGYYAALEKGYYKDLGLDVTIKERDLRYNNVQQVINGEAEYGISDSVLLLYATKQQNIKIVTPIFQHSPGVILTLKSSGIDTPYKLQDKQLTFYKKDTDGFAILAMLKSMGITPDIKRSRGTQDYTLLQDKKTDAYACYLTNEPFYYQQRGIAINIINPANYGFDLYGDILFTNAAEAKNHPQRVEKFREATLKGWEYALENKEEIIELIKTKYRVTKSRQHLQYEADAIEQMIQSKSIPLGTLDKGRIEYTLKEYKKAGLIEQDIPLNEYIFESFNRGLSFTAAENAYLLQKGSINLCIDPNWMPFEKNLNGRYIGITADYFKLFEEQLKIPINLVGTKTWTESLEMAKQRKCDIMSLVMPTNSRKEYLNFTKPYIKMPLVIATRIDKRFVNSIMDIEDKKLGIVKGYAFTEILKEKYPTLDFVEVKSVSDGLEKVENGKLYGFIDTLATVGYQIQKEYIGELKIAGKLDEEWSGGVGVRDDEPLLKSIFDKAIDDISAKRHQEILNKWVSVNFEQDKNYTIVFEWIGALTLIFGTILFISMRANKNSTKRYKIVKS